MPVLPLSLSEIHVLQTKHLRPHKRDCFLRTRMSDECTPPVDLIAKSIFLPGKLLHILRNLHDPSIDCFYFVPELPGFIPEIIKRFFNFSAVSCHLRSFSTSWSDRISSSFSGEAALNGFCIFFSVLLLILKRFQKRTVCCFYISI